MFFGNNCNCWWIIIIIVIVLGCSGCGFGNFGDRDRC